MWLLFQSEIWQSHILIDNKAFEILVVTKVLNPARWSCPGFSMECNMMPSCPVLILGTRDVPRHTDWMLAGQPCPDMWDGTLSWCSTGRFAGT